MECDAFLVGGLKIESEQGGSDHGRDEGAAPVCEHFAAVGLEAGPQEHVGREDYSPGSWGGFRRHGRGPA